EDDHLGVEEIDEAGEPDAEGATSPLVDGARGGVPCAGGLGHDRSGDRPTRGDLGDGAGSLGVDEQLAIARDGPAGGVGFDTADAAAVAARPGRVDRDVTHL